MKRIYECPQSKGIKVSTILAFLFVFVVLMLEIYFFTEMGRSMETIIVTSILLLVAFSSFLVFPLYIMADDEGIGIRTLIRTVHIPFQDIDRIERLDGGEKLFGIKNAVRIFGIGGVFGFIGLFRMKGVGTFRSYITDEKKAFMIYRKNGLPIAISVSEPEDFLPYFLKGSQDEYSG
jgi:hypothetical protein